MKSIIWVVALLKDRQRDPAVIIWSLSGVCAAGRPDGHRALESESYVQPSGRVSPQTTAANAKALRIPARSSTRDLRRRDANGVGVYVSRHRRRQRAGVSGDDVDGGADARLLGRFGCRGGG